MSLLQQKNMSAQKNNGIEFEKIVADIQARIDPNAHVLHNQSLTDRLGQNRQFDVVIRGKFAGHEILGVIECKDFNKKVGTPEIDAFVTKSQDINANFKIIVSRKGFTKPAIQKAKHYGVQTLSLMPNSNANNGFKVGNYWFADIYYWKQMSLKLLFVVEPKKQLVFNVHDVKIKGQKVIDWFTNYLISEHELENELGWVAGVGITFENNQLVHINDSEFFECKGLEFRAERGIYKKQKFVGINGAGFVDWQNNKATMPPQDNIHTDAVQTDFMDWDERLSDSISGDNFLNVKIIMSSIQFEKIENSIDLDNL